MKKVIGLLVVVVLVVIGIFYYFNTGEDVLRVGATPVPHAELLELTPKEFQLLKFLMININKVLTRNLLLEKIWGYDYMGDTRTVDVHIRRLRMKIGDSYIKTVRGVGYKFAKME